MTAEPAGPSSLVVVGMIAASLPDAELERVEPRGVGAIVNLRMGRDVWRIQVDPLVVWETAADSAAVTRPPLPPSPRP
jgi:hypothetical protein